MNLTDTSSQKNKFWPLICRLYDEDGVKDLCLSLQDEFGCDVNVILILVALEALGMVPTEESLANLDIESGEWQEEVLAPLRQSRRDLKIMPPKGDLLDIIQNLEMIAEKAQHESLFDRLELVPVSRRNQSQLLPYIDRHAGSKTALPDLSPLMKASRMVSFA